MTCGPLRSLKFICLISSVSILANLVNAVSYGPSLVSLTRWDRLVRGPTIFNPDTGRVISLEDYPNYSVVIPLAPDSPGATSNQVFISRRVSGPGEFTVEAPPGYGVMAVIQSLDLRVADDACNDFILFSEVDGANAGGAETTGTCGKVDIRDTSPTPQGLVGPRSFISPSGRMKILFYHGFIWGLVRNFNFDIFDSSLNPDLKVEIAFTAYKECAPSNSSSSGDTNGPAQLSLNLFAPCSISSVDKNTCIRQELFCDRIINCAFSDDFASDEDAITCLDHSANIIERLAKLYSAETESVSSTEKQNSSLPTNSSTTSALDRSNSTDEPSTTEKPNIISGEIRNYQGGIGTDAAGLIGLVRKFPHVEITRPKENYKTIIVKGRSQNSRFDYNTTSTPNSLETTTSSKRFKETTTSRKLKETIITAPAPAPVSAKNNTKMPLEEGRLFVDFKAEPIEDSLIDGKSIEDNSLDSLGKNEEASHSSLSPQTIAGIIAVTAIVLILLGLLRIYYCYNKVIWNPHGNLKQTESPPETPDSNIKRKMKALAVESEEIFNEKKGKLKEQPPSYEILFPLPDEKDVHHYEVLKV